VDKSDSKHWLRAFGKKKKERKKERKKNSFFGHPM